VTTLAALAVGALLMLLVEVLLTCVLALLLWSGARRAGADLVRAAEKVRPTPEPAHGPGIVDGCTCPACTRARTALAWGPDSLERWRDDMRRSESH
jgi:hypothetical protein